MAVLFRQTNIVWVFFIAATAILDDFENSREKKEKLMNLANYLKINLLRILIRYKLFLLNGLAFLLFVYVNKGIVVGKSKKQIFSSLTFLKEIDRIISQ